jgi:phosphoenolpyruvate carboxylase
MNIVELSDLERALRDDIRLVGRVLGDTVRRQQGEAVFATVERIRQISIAFRRDGDAAARRELEVTLDSLSDERTIDIVRAFSYFSHLANIAEDQHTIRTMRMQAQSGAPPPRETVRNALARFRAAAVPRARLHKLFETILISPVLTAHPTEVRRKSVLDREIEVAEILGARDRMHQTPGELAEGEVALSRAILTLWQTSLLRRGKPTVVDEVANGLSYYDHTFLEQLPRLYAELEDGLAAGDSAWANTELPSFLRMGSWIGGDRDGNPFVDAEVLRQTIAMQCKRAVDFYLAQIDLLGGELSLDRARVSISAQLEELIGRTPDPSPRREAEP